MFDRDLIADMANVVGQELRAMVILRANFQNSLDCWGPVINLNRDPRWGRNGEGGTEDAYAMGQLAKACFLGPNLNSNLNPNATVDPKPYFQGVDARVSVAKALSA